MAEGGQDVPDIGPGTAQPAQEIFPVPDEGSEKENMEKQRELLVERMESEFGLLDKLRKSLTNMETAEVRSKTTIFDKNMKLLELIFQKNKHQDLISALIDTRQTHLVNWVRGNGVHRTDFKHDWPLDKREIDILEDNQENWIDLVDPCELSSLLFSKEVLNRRQLDFIKSKPTNYEKNEELLSILRRCSQAAYFTTIKCLRGSNQGHIANFLEGNGVVVQAHANLDAVRLDETETQIVRDMANLLLQTPEDRRMILLQATQIKVIASKKGSSIVLYIYCETIKELMYLCKVIDKKEMKDDLETLFKTLSHDTNTKVVDLYIVETEISKAKKFFLCEESRDKQDISRPLEERRHEPVQERMSEAVSSHYEEQIVPRKSFTASLEAERSERKVEGAKGGHDDSDEESDDDFEDDDYDYDEEDDLQKQKQRMMFEGLDPALEEMEEAVGKIQLSELTRMDIIAAIMRNNTDYLMEYMKPEGLIDKLHATDCLTDDDTRYIKTLSIRSEKNDEILNVIDDEKKYNDLIQCLRRTKQHLAADIVEKGGVVLKMKVTLKKAPTHDVEKQLVKIIGTLHDKSVPKREEVVRFLSQLRRGSLEVLDAQYERGVILWLWVRSEAALGKIRSWYKSKKLNKLLQAFFELLISRPIQLPTTIRTDIEDIQMEFSAWPPKLDLIHELPVAEGVACGVTTLLGKIFVLCQKPTEVLVFEGQDYSKPSKRIPVKEISNPVDIVACHRAACLYITDATSSSVWKVMTNDGKVIQWLQNVGNPYTLSLTANGEVVMVRHGEPSSTLEVHGPDGKKLHDIKLPPKISFPNHAVETSAGTFFVSYGKEDTGIYEIDKGGNTIGYLDFVYEPIVYLSVEVNSILEQLCKEVQLGYPRHLVLSKYDQLYAADFQSGEVAVFDSNLCLEQVIGREDVKQALCLCLGEGDNQVVIIHGEKRTLCIYQFGTEISE